MQITVGLDSFVRRNWVLEPWPGTDQWMFVLTGVIEVNDFHGTSGDWNYAQLYVGARELIDDPIAQRNIPLSNPDNQLGFRVAEWAPYATLNSISNDGQAINAGWTVDAFDVNLAPLQLPPPNGEAKDFFDSLTVDLGVRDTDGYVARIGYSLTLFGGIAEYVPQQI